ncbi:MAG: hypothetical protein LUI13_14015 [Lachnospiraceae bacterium]|nr:hypothetical protein [Lachnospiraceae bacterium]
MSQWIWHFGELEIYHNMMLHTRRMEYGHPEPPVWKVYAPEPVILFSKKGITDGGCVRWGRSDQPDLGDGGLYLPSEQQGIFPVVGK